jgi:23S rRNA (guanosine2251-2'-O)-methyltransferase
MSGGAPLSKDRQKGPRGPRKPDQRTGASGPRDEQRRGEQRRPAGPNNPRPRHNAPRQHGRERPQQRFAPDIDLIWGFHSVREALRAKRRKIVRLWASAAAAEKLAPEIAESGAELRLASGEEIDAMLPEGAVHQGLLLEARAKPALDVEDLPTDGLILVLDQVTDPHNVGAILRTAAAFGVNAIVLTERHSPAMTGVLAKAASGGLEHVDIVSVVNLARAMDALGDLGYLRVGLDSDAPSSLAQAPLTRPMALVLGAEGKGLRRLTREKCDLFVRIDLPGAVRSLNVSNACAVALTIATMKLG